MIERRFPDDVKASPATAHGARVPLLEREYGNLLSCVRCGLCLTSCPTYVLTGHEAESPRGRVATMRALAEGRLALTPDLVQHQESCLVCDACTAVCPAGVHMDPLQVALRTTLTERRPPSRIRRSLRTLVYRGLFGDLGRLRVALQLPRWYQRLGIAALARRSGLLRALRLSHLEALLPPMPDAFVVPRGETYPGQSGGARTDTVALFAGCVMSTALAPIDRATIRVLQRAGCDVVNPAGQQCCGALHAHGGDATAARALARRNIVAFGGCGDATVVVNAAGCGAMLKDYPHYFADDAAWSARARAFAARVRDVTEFLAPRSLPYTRAVPRVVTLQDACHLAHAQRITDAPRALLRAVPGIELRDMGESGLCCGSAGVYNVTHPDQATRLQQRKLDHALATGASVIATTNPGCLLQLRAGLAERGRDVVVKHVVELLDEATAP